MVLTSHAVFGAALAAGGRLNPFTAFLVGFGSHFVLDALPHWEYELKSSRFDRSNPLHNNLVFGREFLGDLIKITFDFCLGLGLAWFFFVFGAGAPAGAVWAGALGGVLPDLLSFVQMKVKLKPLIALQRLHILAHTKLIITNPTTGVPLQAFLLVGALFLGSWNLFGY